MKVDEILDCNVEFDGRALARKIYEAIKKDISDTAAEKFRNKSELYSVGYFGPDDCFHLNNFYSAEIRKIMEGGEAEKDGIISTLCARATMSALIAIFEEAENG